MTREEIIGKLEDIVADGGSIAELQACKLLLSLPEYALVAVEGSSDPFEELDAGDELAPRRQDRSQAA